MSELTMVKSVFAGGLGYASLYLAYHYLSTEFRPQLRRLARAGSVARTRIHRAWHVHVGPSRRQLEEARRTLGDRQYYELYDDLYRTMQSAGIETPEYMKIGRFRDKIYADIERLRAEQLLPGPGASVVDLGSGDGQNAIKFARLGYCVTGVELSPTATDMARNAAEEQVLDIDFVIGDVTSLETIEDGSFDLAADIGCLHMLAQRDHRHQYFRQVRRILKPRGKYLLFTHMTTRDVLIADETQHILNSISLVEERELAGDGPSVMTRGCGYRTGSLDQYRQELAEEGFEIIEDHGRWSGEAPFGMILARPK